MNTYTIQIQEDFITEQYDSSPYVIPFEINRSLGIICEMNARYEGYIKEKQFKDDNEEMKASTSEARRKKSGDIFSRLRQKSYLEKQNESFNRKANRTINYCILSICIAIVFVALTLPANIPLISYPIYHQPFSWFNRTYISFSNFLEAANYSSNFFIYCIANSEIRKAAWDFVKSIGRIIPRKNQKI